jgi:hypothetical protein
MRKVQSRRVIETDPLRLSACPACGYALEGLASEGTCPECGTGYDQRTIVLHGWSSPSQLDVATGRPWVVVLVTAVFGWYAWDSVRSGLRLGIRNPAAYLCAALALLSVAWGLWRRWNSDMPGLLQVRLSPEGCCQLDTTAKRTPPTVTPWRATRIVKVEPRSEQLVRLRVECAAPWYRMENVPVDAIVKCTPQQAAALRAKIAEWRS